MKKKYLTLIAAGTVAAAALALTSCGSDVSVDTDLYSYKDADKITSEKDFDEKLEAFDKLYAAFTESMATEQDAVMTETESEAGKEIIGDITVSMNSSEKTTISYDYDNQIHQYDKDYSREENSADETVSDKIVYSVQQYDVGGSEVYVNMTTGQYHSYADTPSITIHEFNKGDIDYSEEYSYYYTTDGDKTILTIIKTEKDKNSLMEGTEERTVQYIVGTKYYEYIKYTTESTKTLSADYTDVKYDDITFEAKDVTLTKASYDGYVNSAWDLE